MVDHAKRAWILALLVPALLAASKSPPNGDSVQAETYSRNRCGGSSVGWAKPGRPSGYENVFNRVDITPSGSFWNGAKIDQATLHLYLGQIAKLTPQPITLLVPSMLVDCRSVEALREQMNSRLHCRKTFLCAEYLESELDEVQPPLLTR